MAHVIHGESKTWPKYGARRSQPVMDIYENIKNNNCVAFQVHLRDCYGKLIKLYCTLLIAKLEFHRRNPRFPGNLAITHSELENIGENDINN